MKDTQHIKVHLNVCDTSDTVSFRETSYAAGHKGPVDVTLRILNGDILEIEVPGKSDYAKVGGASEIVGVSIRICKDKTSVIAVYKNPEMNLNGCCVCGPCGTCVYGSWGCDPGCR